jgi:4-hydroxy-tetrahydrodipicolinate reductase
MKLALLGYGKMGQEIEKTAISRGHTIVLIIDVNNQNELPTRIFSKQMLRSTFPPLHQQ